MFLAAFTSALQAKPQATHRNAAWLSRDSLRCARTRCSAARCTRAVPSPPARGPCPPAGGPAVPSRPADAPVEAGLLRDVPAGRVLRAPGGPGHVPDLKVLDADHVEPPGEIGGGLLRPVLAPVRLPRLQPRDRGLRLAAAARTALGPGELPLGAGSRRASRPDKPGKCSISPVDSAALTSTPRSIPTTSPVPGPGTGRG